MYDGMTIPPHPYVRGQITCSSAQGGVYICICVVVVVKPESKIALVIIYIIRAEDHSSMSLAGAGGVVLCARTKLSFYWGTGCQDDVIVHIYMACAD